MKDIDFKTKLIDLCDWFMGTSLMTDPRGVVSKKNGNDSGEKLPPEGGEYIVVSKWHYLKANPICGECLAPSYHKWNGEVWIHSCSKCKQKAQLSLQAFKEKVN